MTEISPIRQSESSVSDKHNQHWPALREAGKIDRRNLTDAIERFKTYVDPKGEISKHPEWAFSNFTKSIYAGFDLNSVQREHAMSGKKKSRDLFDITQLRFLQMAESTAALIINNGIDNNELRKDIKDAVKRECAEIGKFYLRLTSEFGGNA